MITMTRYALLCLLAISPLMGLAEEPASEQPALSFRLAELEEAEGLTKASVPGKDEPIYLHPHSIVTGQDIVSVGFEPGQARGIAVNLQINPAAAERMRKTTRENMEKPLAIVLDGNVIMAPIIRAEISDKLMITGSFSDEDLTRIFTALVLEGSLRK